MTRVRSVLVKVLRSLALAFLMVAALGTAVSFMPMIPVLGIVGPLTLGPLGPWFPVLTLAGAIWMFRRWRKDGNKRALVFAGLAAFATAGSVYILTQQLAALKGAGARFDLVEAFMATSQNTLSLFRSDDGISFTSLGFGGSGTKTDTSS